MGMPFCLTAQAFVSLSILNFRRLDVKIRHYLTIGLAMALTSSAGFAQNAAALNARALAATCANCHGSEGQAVPGSAIPSLAGTPKDYLIKQMEAFKNGSRPATVMHQLAKGYTDAQVETLATYFASLKR